MFVSPLKLRTSSHIKGIPGLGEGVSFEVESNILLPMGSLASLLVEVTSWKPEILLEVYSLILLNTWSLISS